MKDIQQQQLQDDELEQTLIDIWKQFAWYLKDVAKRHDELIEINKDSIFEIKTSIAKMDITMDHIKEKINDIDRSQDKYCEQLGDLKDSVSEHHRKEKAGWTWAEKIIAIIGFLIMMTITLWDVLSK